jgi:hypothetical protein
MNLFPWNNNSTCGSSECDPNLRGPVLKANRKESALSAVSYEPLQSSFTVSKRTSRSLAQTFVGTEHVVSSPTSTVIAMILFPEVTNVARSPLLKVMEML